jgi:AraC family transcriptional regulator, transcriptional activator of pobA
MDNISIQEFYKQIFGDGESKLDYLLDIKNLSDLGHFNVFDAKKFYFSASKKPAMTYNRSTIK